MNRNYNLDILRFFAIIPVMLLHTLEFTSNIPDSIKYIFAYGWAGVDLFFVLSGYLIGSQAFSETDTSVGKSLTVFWIKRWFRTFPLYYFVLLIYIFIKPLAVHKPFADDSLKFFFYLQNYLTPKDFVQSWSLCIEEQFYLIFPLLLFGLNFRRLPKYIWIIPAFLSLFFRFLNYQNGIVATQLSFLAEHFQFPFHTHLDGISFGLILAAYKDIWQNWNRRNLILCLGIFSLIATLYYIEPTNLYEKTIPSYFLLAFSFSFILIGIHDQKWAFSPSLISQTALWSYGLYLWNNLVAKVVLKLNFITSDLVKIILFFIGSYLLSFLTYKFIEVPFLNIRSKVLKKLSH